MNQIACWNAEERRTICSYSWRSWRASFSTVRGATSQLEYREGQPFLSSNNITDFSRVRKGEFPKISIGFHTYLLSVYATDQAQSRSRHRKSFVPSRSTNASIHRKRQKLISFFYTHKLFFLLWT